MDEQAPRPYRSDLRRRQADQTRTRIRRAAQELFLRDGYRSTTLTAVADRAGVAVDTIYKTYGTKLAVLSAVMDATIGGDDSPVAVLDRPGPQTMRAETDQRRQVEMLATGVADRLERIGPMDDVLRQAAAVDAGAAHLRDDIQQRQRREAMATMVGWIAARGPLAAGLSHEAAVGAVWTLTSPEVHRLLRVDSDWPLERYRDWLAAMLAATLLP